jgi:divalent metal cation (Fe/Co/Zn/Cd) transporter
MKNFVGKKITAKRQKTLFASFLLSLWAPLATGIAVIMGRSLTQIADFVRRTVEFLVLLLSWLVFRYLTRGKELTAAEKKRWEKIVNRSVAVALGVSGLSMFFLALFHFQNLGPGGNVIPGLIIAVLGFVVNFGFWQRYRALERAGHDPIIAAQRQLYLAKIFVDICVVLALSAVLFMPTQAVRRQIDILGSLAVASYLLWSSFRTWGAKQSAAKLPGGKQPGH